jgi:NADH:ubiquinone oxidoreductase subunit
MPVAATREVHFVVQSRLGHNILWITVAMDHCAASRYISRMDIGTRLNTWLYGREVGRDGDGNIYYEDKRSRADGPKRRWVAFNGATEASAVPPEWHAWLHYTVDSPLAATGRPWQKPHLANPTGSAAGYRPAGHDYEGGKRAAATGDYEAWTPGS